LWRPGAGNVGGMADIDNDLAEARDAARRYVTVTGEMAAFLDQLTDPVDPAAEAEYEALLGREELVRNERQEAVHRLGLVARSLEGEDA
jgi:hypothetical protein